jgi:hypothetical protein
VLRLVRVERRGLEPRSLPCEGRILPVEISPHRPKKTERDRRAQDFRRRPRGGSNPSHLIDNQAASPDAYGGKRASEQKKTKTSGGATGTRTPISAVQEQRSAFELSPQEGSAPRRRPAVHPARREGVGPSRRGFWEPPGHRGLRRMWPPPRPRHLVSVRRWSQPFGSLYFDLFSVVGRR